jgi:hypothetical protein
LLACARASGRSLCGVVRQLYPSVRDQIVPDCVPQQSRQFLDPARRDKDHAGYSASLPAYFLAGRAIELGLKSYLLLKGRTEAELRRASHDLAAALDLAIGHGLASLMTVTPESDHAVRWINLYYQSKDLEYPTTGYKSYPERRYLSDFAAALLAGLEPELRAWRPNDS